MTIKVNSVSTHDVYNNQKTGDWSQANTKFWFGEGEVANMGLGIGWYGCGIWV
jgi:hypothetical protein